MAGITNVNPVKIGLCTLAAMATPVTVATEFQPAATVGGNVGAPEMDEDEYQSSKSFVAAVLFQYVRLFRIAGYGLVFCITNVMPPDELFEGR